MAKNPFANAGKQKDPFANAGKQWKPSDGAKAVSTFAGAFTGLQKKLEQAAHPSPPPKRTVPKSSGPSPRPVPISHKAAVATVAASVTPFTSVQRLTGTRAYVPTSQAGARTPAGPTPAQIKQQQHDLARKVLNGQLTPKQAERNAKELGLPNAEVFGKIDTKGTTIGDIARGAAHAVVEEAPKAARIGEKVVATPGIIPGIGTGYRHDIARRTYAGVTQGLPAVADLTGSLVGRLFLGAAGEAAQGYGAVQQQLTGRRFAPSPEQGRQQARIQAVTQAGIVPTEVATQAGPAALKVLAGGGGAVAGLYEHPSYTIRNLVTEGTKMMIGAGVAPVVAGARLSDPSTSRAEKENWGRQTIHGMFQQLQDAYGSDVTVGEAFRAGAKNPAFYGLNAYTLLAAGAQGIGVIGNLMRGGLGEMSLGDAIRLTRLNDAVRLTRYPETERTLTLRGTEGGASRQVPIPQAQSVLWRAAVQKPYDITSRAIEATPVVRRTPIVRAIGENARAGRAERKAIDQAMRRAPAHVRALFSDVVSFIKRNGGEYKTALALIHQKPVGFTNEEWLQAIMADLRDQLETGTFTTPAEKLTPGVQRLTNRVRRMESKFEDAITARRARANVNIADRQDELANSLDDLRDQHYHAVAERNAVRNDSNLTAEEKADQIRIYDARIRVIDREGDYARQELDDLSVQQPPVEHPNRDQFIQTVNKPDYFRENPQAAEDLVKVEDARARAYGTRNNVDPGEWYGLTDWRFARTPEEIPAAENVLFQRGWTPKRLQNERARFDFRINSPAIKAMLDHETGLLGKKGSGHRAEWTSRADFENLTRDAVRRLKEGYPYAKNWYRDSGRSIREFSGGDRGVADTVASLFAIYSPQKPVAENLALAFRVYSDWQLGRRPMVGSATQRDLAEKALKGEDWLGGLKKEQQPKVRRFYANILKHVDRRLMRSKGFNGREVTGDGWMGAVYGYGENTGATALSVPQIRFIERHIQAIADHFGLEPEQVQAAVWTSIKAERDRQTAKAYLNPVTREKALSDSGESFADALFQPQYTVRFPMEAMSNAPGKEFLGDLTPEQQIAYTRDYGRMTVDTLRNHGFVARLTDGGFGFYINDAGKIEINPAFAVEVAVGDVKATKFYGKLDKAKRPVFEPIPARYYRVRPDQRRFYDGLASTMGEALQQEASVWSRRFLNRRNTDATSWRITIGRPMTRDEMNAAARAIAEIEKGEKYHATQHSDGFTIALNNPDEVLQRTIGVDRARRTGQPELAATRTSEHTAAHNALETEVDGILAKTFADSPGDTLNLDYVRSSHRGSYLGKDSYHEAQRHSGRPGLLGRVRGELSVRGEGIDARYRDDPAGAAAEHFGTAGPGGHELRDLNQSRQGDVLGATRYLDSEEGRRIVWLTQHADASTVLHEMFGHSMVVMRREYPQEFAKLEEFIGKPYADWNVADHERVARFSERYFDSGLAPTPELVDVMDRIKTYMRATYAGMRAELGERMPVEARVLFDTALGAYDDANVARVAMMMSREHYGREELAIQRFGGAKVLAQEELRALKKGVETRRYNRSLDGMQNQLDEMEARLQKMDERKKATPEEEWTAEDQAHYVQLEADVLRQQAEMVVRADKREQDLRRKLSDLEKVLQGGLEKRGFEEALAAMKFISDDREKILRDAFGVDYEKIFEDRRDLLADWLVSRGFLNPEYVHGSANYFPHIEGEAFAQMLKRPAAALESRVVGKSKTDYIRLHKRNQMILWQRGSWNADPAVLLEAHSRALGYEWMNRVKQSLWDIGRPLTLEEELGRAPLPTDAFIINPAGTPISHGLRRELNGAETQSAHLVHDAESGGMAGNMKLQNLLRDYAERFMIDGEHVPPEILDPSISRNLRVVDKRVVNAILRPLRGGRSGGAKTWDVLTTMARFGLIYANVPGYMIANSIGNAVLLLAQAGTTPWKIPTMFKDLATYARNKPLRYKILAEMGELPAQAAISRGRDFAEQTGASARGLEQHWLQFESAVDRYPRAVSWMYEARKRGYKTPQQMMDLIDGKTPKMVRDRESTMHFAVNHMIDFNKLSDFERQTITRALFIWPYVRGATSWPFWYAKNYPVRTAAGMLAGQQLQQESEQTLGPRPWQYKDLFAIGPRVGQGPSARARVVNAASTSPTSMAADQIKLISDTVASLLGRKPDAQTSRLVDSWSPILRDAIQIGTQRNDFGREQSLQEILKNFALEAIPGVSVFRALTGEQPAPRVFRKYDRSWEAGVLRKFVRIPDETVSIPWLNAEAYRSGTIPTSEKIQQAIAQSHADWKASGTKDVYNSTVRRAATMKVVYADRMAAYAKQKKGAPEFTPSPPVSPGGQWNFNYNLTPYEQAKILYATIKHYYPAAARPRSGKEPVLPAPEAVLAKAKVIAQIGYAPKPDSATGQKIMSNYVNIFEDQYMGPATRAAAMARGAKQAKAMAREKKAHARAAA